MSTSGSRSRGRACTLCGGQPPPSAMCAKDFLAGRSFACFDQRVHTRRAFPAAALEDFVRRKGRKRHFCRSVCERFMRMSGSLFSTPKRDITAVAFDTNPTGGHSTRWGWIRPTIPLCIFFFGQTTSFLLFDTESFLCFRRRRKEGRRVRDGCAATARLILSFLSFPVLLCCCCSHFLRGRIVSGGVQSTTFDV